MAILFNMDRVVELRRRYVVFSLGLCKTREIPIYGKMEKS